MMSGRRLCPRSWTLAAARVVRTMRTEAWKRSSKSRRVQLTDRRRGNITPGARTAMDVGILDTEKEKDKDEAEPRAAGQLGEGLAAVSP